MTETTPTDPVTAGAVTIDKVLLGRDQAEGEFSFVLEGIAGTNTEGMSSTGTNAADGSVTLGAGVTFDKVGTYSFRIREVGGDLGGVAYERHHLRRHRNGHRQR